MPHHGEEIRLPGHIVDSLSLARVLDTNMDLGGDYTILDLVVGKQVADTSTARMRMGTPNRIPREG